MGSFTRKHLTFIEDEKGSSVRYGKKGDWVIPKLPALSSGEIKKAEYTEKWATVGERVITPLLMSITFP